jgi:hypothetical protein
MKSRFMSDLTTPEVAQYLRNGGDLALLPLGSMEMHGPHQPLGTDTVIARAFCLRLAEAADGLVLPDLPYTWAGATDGFAGTISIEPEHFQSIVQNIAVRVLTMGFKRVVLASFHGPNTQVLYTTARRLFETNAPVLLVDLGKHFSREAEEIFPAEREASLLLAAYRILGIDNLYSEKDLSYEDTAPPFSEYYGRLRMVGTVGMFYQDMRHHACPHTNVSCEKGLEFIRVQVQALASALDDLGRYADEVKNQTNKGWSR